MQYGEGFSVILFSLVSAQKNILSVFSTRIVSVYGITMSIAVARLGHDHPSHPSHKKGQAALLVVLGKQDLVCAGG